MKIPHTQFYDYMGFMSKIEFDVGGKLLFFPLDVDDKDSTTEYGTMMTKPAGMDDLGSYPTDELVTGVALIPSYAQEKDADGNMRTRIDKLNGTLAYCQASKLIKFDIIEYMALIKQEGLTDDERKKISGLDCYIADSKDMMASRLELS